MRHLSTGREGALDSGLRDEDLEGLDFYEAFEEDFAEDFAEGDFDALREDIG